MPPTKIDHEHHLLRYVSWARLRKDDNDKVVGVLGEAFQLRNGEEYLSATWAEFFEQASHEDNVTRAVGILRQSNLQVRPKSGFAVGQVKFIDEDCKACSCSVRFLHEKETDNPAHSALRGWGKLSDEQLERIAVNSWSSFRLNSEIPE
jgi:hypothetical protein